MINKLCTYQPVRGFTLIETLVAVLILATAIVGPLTIASRGLQSALVAKNQAIADYLAQDAVEYVRFARDTNGLQGLGWLDGGAASPATVLTSCVSTNGTAACTIDSTGNTAPQPCVGACGALRYNVSNADYNYNALSSSNISTPFTRTVNITTPVCDSAGALCNADEASVSVRVSWSDLPGITHSVVVRENLLNWQ